MYLILEIRKRSCDHQGVEDRGRVVICWVLSFRTKDAPAPLIWQEKGDGIMAIGIQMELEHMRAIVLINCEFGV